MYKNFGNENIVILLFISDVRCLYSYEAFDMIAANIMHPAQPKGLHYDALYAAVPKAFDQARAGAGNQLDQRHIGDDFAAEFKCALGLTLKQRNIPYFYKKK